MKLKITTLFLLPKIVILQLFLKVLYITSYYLKLISCPIFTLLQNNHYGWHNLSPNNGADPQKKEWFFNSVLIIYVIAVINMY